MGAAAGPVALLILPADLQVLGLVARWILQMPSVASWDCPAEVNR